MAGYTLLRDGYQVTETATTTTGTKIYLDGGSDSLPAIGDTFDAVYNYVYCTSIQKVPYFVDDDDACDNGYKYTCQYSTATQSPYTLVSGDPEQRRFSIGGEIFAIGSEDSNWGWANSAGTAPTETIEDGQKLFVSSPVGTISWEKEVTTGDYSAFIQDLIAKAGCINDATFQGFAKGQVLFTGAEGSLKRKSDGTKVWVFNVTMSWKTLTAGNAPTQDQWQYIWRKDSDFYEIPASGDIGAGTFEYNLYQYANFNDLLP